MQQDSVCRQLSAFGRSGVAGSIVCWKVLAMVIVTGWPSAVLANEGDRFSPHLIVIVDESGSMRNRHAWLADALPELGRALDDRNVNTLPDRKYFTLAGFTTISRELSEHGSEIDAARAVSELRTDGGTEDGYVAIRDVLSRHLNGNDYAPTTVLLITDEDRDVTDRDLTLANLADHLIMNGIVVHAVIRARIVCPDQKTGIAIDQNRVAMMPDHDEISTCPDARVRTFDDYAELAWATGGLVWDFDRITGGPERQTDPESLQQIVGVLSEMILMQWPTGPLWTNFDYWPKDPRPGDVITFNGTSSFSKQSGRQISNWAWDLDGDGTFEQDGPVVANIYSAPGRYRIVLKVTDDSNPLITGRKVAFLHIAQ